MSNVRSIYKYYVRGNRVTVPKGARLLSVGKQYDYTVLWAAVDPAAEVTEVSVPTDLPSAIVSDTEHADAVMTGGYVPLNRTYICTFITTDGTYVQHIYK